MDNRGQSSILEVYLRDDLEGSTGVRKFTYGLSKVLAEEEVREVVPGLTEKHLVAFKVFC